MKKACKQFITPTRIVAALDSFIDELDEADFYSLQDRKRQISLARHLSRTRGALQDLDHWLYSLQRRMILLREECVNGSRDKKALEKCIEPDRRLAVPETRGRRSIVTNDDDGEFLETFQEFGAWDTFDAVDTIVCDISHRLVSLREELLCLDDLKAPNLRFKIRRRLMDEILVIFHCRVSISKSLNLCDLVGFNIQRK
jgi:hypothetical protein